ncbi:MAG: nitrous oxide reductase accessory protein NosL [Methylococcaceae bacterium]
MKSSIKPVPAYVGRAVRALAPKARTARTTNIPRPLFSKIMLWLFLLFSMNISYGDEPTVTIKKSDRCPVCGMFVYKYPKWVAQIIFTDGSYYFYDGAKDMFKHIFDTAKYTPGKSAENIKDIYVTDYYEVELVDAKSAFYVLGSDVLGPMGHELLPFKDQESAQEFLEDHKGKSIIHFQDVTPAIIESLDHRT